MRTRKIPREVFSRLQPGQPFGVFTGRFSRMLDAKYRFTLPDSFRRGLKNDALCFIILQAPTQKRLVLSPRQILEGLANQALTPSEERILFPSCFDASMDKIGRIQVPQEVRQIIDFSFAGAVLIIGRGSCIEIVVKQGGDPSPVNQ